jgi:hypothetical protein
VVAVDREDGNADVEVGIFVVYGRKSEKCEFRKIKWIMFEDCVKRKKESNALFVIHRAEQ